MTQGQFYLLESVGKGGRQGQVLGMFVQDPVVDNVLDRNMKLTMKRGGDSFVNGSLNGGQVQKVCI